MHWKVVKPYIFAGCRLGVVVLPPFIVLLLCLSVGNSRSGSRHRCCVRITTAVDVATTVL